MPNTSNVPQHSRSRLPGLVDSRTPINIVVGLLAYWRMEEASGSRADSIGSNTLTDTGSVTSTTGIINNAASMSGSGQYLSCAGGLTVTGTPRSVSMWVYPTSTSGQKGIASAAAAASPTSGTPLWIMGMGHTGTKFFVYMNGYNDGTSSASVNTWYHLVYTYDGTIGLYVNGTREITTAVGDPALSGATTYIGSGFNAQFPGRIDEVGIWNRALTAAEVSQLYAGGGGYAI